MFRFLVHLRRLAGALWLRVTLFAVLSVAAVVMAHFAAPLIPDQLDERFDAGSVVPLLEILASSMLAVSTFSVGIMVQSHRRAQESTTPRVLDLMLADGLTQTVLGVFVGAFVYALTALILVQAGFDRGVAILMGVTLAVAASVVVALVRWIAHLSTLGTLRDALDRAEAQARTALKAHRRNAALGASPIASESRLPAKALTICARRSGVLQLIDLKGLAACAPGAVWVLRRPGQQVLKGAPLMQLAGHADEETRAAMLDCFELGDSRTFDQDPVYALTVLTEIALRALSPSVNDPGTAIEVISRLERLLWDWAQAEPGGDVGYPQVFVHPWTAADLLEAAFAPVARDGAPMLEVATQLIDALQGLGTAPDPSLAAAACALEPRARAHAGAALRLAGDAARLPAETV
ncbi:MAG: DUF2254 domain-containing protein [Pararhodobacter sp.]